MIAWQLRDRGIRDARVLEVMGGLPRERFLAPEHAAWAYDDRAVPIGLGQTISQPYMVALMTEALRAGPGDRVLEIGTGSGYQTAVLARLVRRVYTVERLGELSTAARARLAELGLDNVDYRVGDGTLGWPEEAPFDRIIVTAGAPDVPPALVEQLGEGGVLVIPAGAEEHQVLLRVSKHGRRLDRESLVGCRFVRLIGRQGWPGRESEC